MHECFLPFTRAPLAELPAGLGKLASFYFHPDPSYRQGKESATGVRGACPHYHLHTPLPDPYLPGTIPEAKSWGLKPQIPTVDKNTVTGHHNLMKKENGIRNTSLNANVGSCGTYCKALKAAPASSLTPHTCPEL